jgi:lipopolysaccharide biosynthesis glycosyltransferase
MHCFDNNYVIPAAIAFYSMLDNSDKNCYYIFYILHSDITADNEKKLQDTIVEFYNAKLVFVDMKNKFAEEFRLQKTKAFYTKEILYKLIAPSLFPQYDTMIIADVDVVYLGDISKSFFSFTGDREEYLLTWQPAIKKNSPIEDFYASYSDTFNEREIEALKSGSAGYLIYNLKKMREDGIEKKNLDCLVQNSYRLRQPEQDVINLVCYPNIGHLPSNALVCSYLYDFYKDNTDFDNDTVYSADEIKYLLENPIQLHFATNIKPWNYPSCTQSIHWYRYLVKTPFFYNQMENLKKKEGGIRNFFIQQMIRAIFKKVFTFFPKPIRLYISKYIHRTDRLIRLIILKE